MEKPRHEHFMREAITQAVIALEKGEVPVGAVVVWNVATGAQERVLEGHAEDVNALAVCGSRLLSGSDDGSVRVWGMGAGWGCERTLKGHERGVFALTTWEGKVVSGSDDDTIRVWDVETGAVEAILRGHNDSIYAFGARGQAVQRVAGRDDPGVEDGGVGGAADGGGVRGGWAAAPLVPGCERAEAGERVGGLWLGT